MYLSYTEILIMKIISPKFYRTFANPPVRITKNLLIILIIRMVLGMIYQMFKYVINCCGLAYFTSALFEMASTHELKDGK